MINAGMAYKLAEAFKNNVIDQEWEDLEKIIQANAKNGYYYHNYTGHIQPENRKKLEKLGYKVETGSQYNESYVNISWRKIDEQ